MSSRPLVSVLIPAFNRERYIRDCVESALAQTITDIEVVISDNASTDRTVEICKKLSGKDSRVRILRNATNVGPLMNWHACVEAARGTYVHLLFSDDRGSPEFLQKTLPFMANPQVAFAFTQASIGEDQHRGTAAYRWKSRTGIYPSDDFVSAQLYGEGVPLSPAAAVFRLEDMKASLVHDAGDPRWDDIFRNYGAGPDMLTYLLSARRFPLVGYVAEPLVFFRAHAGSVTLARNDQVMDGYTRAVVWFLEEGRATSAQLARAVANWWLQKIRQRRAYISWTSHLRRYTDARVSFPWGFVLALSTKIALGRIRRAFGSWFR